MWTYFLRNGIFLCQGFYAFEVCLSVLKTSLLLSQLSLCSLQVGLKRFLVHLEEHISFPDHGPLCVQALLKKTLDPGTDLYPA